jgi:hypothetical protein
MTSESANEHGEPSAIRRTWRSPLASVAAVFVASRLLLFAVISLSRLIMVRGELWHPGDLLSVLDQFDAELWYMNIARHGYWFSTTEPSPVPFFPMFPLLMKLVSFVFHDMRVAGFIVPHLCLLAAALMLFELARTDYGEAVALKAVVFLLFNPVSIFHSSAYSEATFLMFATGAMLAALKRRWFIAALLGMCLSATRNVGVLIAVPLLIEQLRERWEARRSLYGLLHPHLLLLGIVPLGLIAYMLFGYLEWGDPLAFLHASKIWGRSFTSPMQTFSTLANYRPLYRWLFLGTMITAIALLPIGLAAFRIRASYIAWCLLLTISYLCAATMEAWPRYLSIEFPLYIVLGAIAVRLRWSYEPLVGCSIGLFVLSAVLSANGYWFT